MASNNNNDELNIDLLKEQAPSPHYLEISTEHHDVHALVSKPYPYLEIFPHEEVKEEAVYQAVKDFEEDHTYASVDEMTQQLDALNQGVVQHNEHPYEYQPVAPQENNYDIGDTPPSPSPFGNAPVAPLRRQPSTTFNFGVTEQPLHLYEYDPLVKAENPYEKPQPIVPIAISKDAPPEPPKRWRHADDKLPPVPEPTYERIADDLEEPPKKKERSKSTSFLSGFNLFHLHKNKTPKHRQSLPAIPVHQEAPVLSMNKPRIK
ncbi:MAG: hypothetical protein V4490_07290 [Pseudomonadota bacterium]